jgi:hypothetical protein
MSMQPSGPDDDTDRERTSDPATEKSSNEDRPQQDHGDEEGEDEGGAPTEGDYSGLKENQKPVD